MNDTEADLLPWRLLDPAGCEAFNAVGPAESSLSWELRLPAFVAPDFVPPGLLDGEMPDGERRNQASFVESQLIALAACAARLDLDLGRMLATLKPEHLQSLGVSTEGSYTWEAMGFSSAHGRELKRIAAALADLPMLRAGFLSGGVPRTRLREIVDVATPEDESGWLLAVQTLSTRALKATSMRITSSSGPRADPTRSGTCWPSASAAIDCFTTGASPSRAARRMNCSSAWGEWGWDASRRGGGMASEWSHRLLHDVT